MLEDRICVCGSKMHIRNGQQGGFYGCTRFPDCRQTQPIDQQPHQQPVPGSVKAPDPQMSAADLEKHNKQIDHSTWIGYQQRKNWHEKHNVQFPEGPYNPYHHR